MASGITVARKMMSLVEDCHADSRVAGDAEWRS